MASRSPAGLLNLVQADIGLQRSPARGSATASDRTGPAPSRRLVAPDPRRLDRRTGAGLKRHHQAPEAPDPFPCRSPRAAGPRGHITIPSPRSRIPIPPGTPSPSLDIEKRQIARAALQPCRALEQPDRTALGQALRPPPEPLVLTQQRHIPAARDAPFRLSRGTGVEITLPSEVAVGDELENEHVELVRRDADGRLVPQRAQRPGFGPAQPVETAAGDAPYGLAISRRYLRSRC